MEKEYYDTTNKKVADFIKGFFLNVGIAGVHFGLYFLFSYILNALNLAKNQYALILISVLLGIAIIAVEFLLIRHFFKNRRYIAIGMLSSLILPLLVTGFCSIVFNHLYNNL